jgi:glucose/mannose-6-phosphate isomerase
MGGSAIGGELLKDWAIDQITVPIEICRDYHLPKYANKKTLVFVVSYSGETEESLSVFLEAIKRKCMLTSISSGGTLEKFGEELSIPHLKVPSGMAPRATLPYLFMPLPTILRKLGLVSNANLQVSETINTLKRVSVDNAPERHLSDNLSKKLASNLCGTIPVIYGFGFYRSVAQRFKTQFNENSKVPAKWEFFPELNHNEIVGWEAAQKLAKCFSVIFLRDADEQEVIKRRIETTQGLIRREFVKTYEVHSVGKSRLAKMASVICLGDFISVYLAILRRIDPTPVKTISALKKEIEKTGVKIKIVRELQQMAKR